MNIHPSSLYSYDDDNNDDDDDDDDDDKNNDDDGRESLVIKSCSKNFPSLKMAL